jgi:hypothetical protein
LSPSAQTFINHGSPSMTHSLYLFPTACCAVVVPFSILNGIADREKESTLPKVLLKFQFSTGPFRTTQNYDDRRGHFCSCRSLWPTTHKPSQAKPSGIHLFPPF